MTNEPTEAPAPAAPSDTCATCAGTGVRQGAFRCDCGEIIDNCDDPRPPCPDCQPAAARVPGGAAGEALETALSEYNESVRHDGTCGYSFAARTPCSCVKARTADALIAAARAPGPAGGEAVEVAMPLLKGGGHPEERVPEYSAVEKPDVVVAALLDIIRIARTLAVSTGVVVTLDQTRIELNAIVDRAANALAAARAPGPVGGEA